MGIYIYIAYFQTDPHYIQPSNAWPKFSDATWCHSRLVWWPMQDATEKHLARGFKRGWSSFFGFAMLHPRKMWIIPSGKRLQNDGKSARNQAQQLKSRRSFWALNVKHRGVFLSPRLRKGECNPPWSMASLVKGAQNIPKPKQAHAGNDQEAGNSGGRVSFFGWRPWQRFPKADGVLERCSGESCELGLSYTKTMSIGQVRKIFRADVPREIILVRLPVSPACDLPGSRRWGLNRVESWWMGKSTN